ncbi:MULTISPECIES: antibiotic biosynthesis monooxygenase [unclassified Sulfitobacter]|uniref:antibiotic biosynthesis monooxygenase family protein n=2 Tax=Roseobacteraceae TaxID=2854170 RepID=UPI0023073D86|nr:MULTISPECIES: antibiotic biosynthesis monooxygenase [Sulfitobacter]MDF3383117.1 antibiotic biosynthesis monooxygenase [Sulfitobacter sp. Ks11]MDF3386536.1 antibiotic biosynthesis monooxygenase [Sulfitobacter sp. M85]MDF3389955.1 antibiotic biosynthesis monooxygenase [Sulfitobacter sp. Ks16]MDF3400592.1 antibiotic biosynthesis monooxygenase [Sulfitobacter sp. KE39]MDF3404013.1 antibiotic biosynthesis monooxygenase [Sulfitobacter sp. Ks35]
MYLAMNRFTVLLKNAAEFEDLWLSRESNLQEIDGFLSFHMLKGPEVDDSILYASHTMWEGLEHFRAWTTSAQFRNAHARAGQGPKLFEGPPQFEGFTALQKIEALQPL